MSGLGLIFSIVLVAVMIVSLLRAQQKKQQLGPEAVLDELLPREREAILRELEAGRTLNALTRLKREMPNLGPEAAQAVIDLLERNRG